MRSIARSSAHRLAALALGLALLAASVPLASNMGFKLTPNIGPNQAYNMALPWNNNYVWGSDVMNDIRDAGGSIVRITKILPNGKYLDWFDGAPPNNNFHALKSEAYILRTGPGGITTWTVVGSHDPSFAFTFNAGKSFNASPPYHQIFTKASQLFNNMNAQLGPAAIGSIGKVQSNGKFLDWFSGAPPSNDFNLSLGMGVVVKANAGGSGYVWPHY